MKNFIKSFIFVLIFIIIYYSLSYLLLPKANIRKYGMYKTATYEILGEKENTIDAIFLGDSLIYSSIVPMEIYGNFGYTTFDCSSPALILPDAYKYYEIALDSQHPKIAFVEANMFFRDPNKRPWYTKYIKMGKNILPLFNYHDNWKDLIFSDTGLTNIEKGYRTNKTNKPGKNRDYMKENKFKAKILKENEEYLKKIVDLAKEKNVRLIVIGLPGQTSWNNTRDMKFEELSQKYGFEYMNLNRSKYNLGIDWTKETKDKGNHLNYYGAKKVSKYFGEYLKDTNYFVDHRNDPNYKEWNNAYLKHIENLNN